MGVVELLLPAAHGRLDAAVKHLQLAMELDRRSPAILNDLAAAYLVRAEANDDPRDLVRALSQARAALDLDGGLREGLFNDALARESLGLRSAVTAWRVALRSEPDPAWAKEAGSHRDRLELAILAAEWLPAKVTLDRASREGDSVAVRTVTARFPRAARLYVEEEILPAWAVATQRDQEATASALLGVASTTADALAEGGGDRLLASAVDAIVEAHRAGDAVKLATLASGFAAYGEGVAAYNQNRMPAARERFEVARRSMSRVGNPFASWAEINLAVCDYQRQDYAAALIRLTAIVKDPTTPRSPCLEGRAWWIEGLVRIALAQPSDALRAYRLSLAAFDSVREYESAVALHALLADALRYIGEETAAWRQRYAALGGLHELQSPRRRHAVLGEAAMAALKLGEPESARVFQEEAVAGARRSHNALDVAEALRGLAAVELHCQAPRRALASLREAEQELHRLGDTSLEQAVAAEQLEVAGALRLAQDPAEALRLFKSATGDFRRANFRFRLADSLLHEAQASLALRDLAGAEVALEAGISSTESEWSSTLGGRRQVALGDFGSAYTEQRRQLFEKIFEILADQANAGAGFDYAERLHNWGLLDQAVQLPPWLLRAPALEAGHPVSHQRLMAQISPRVAIVEYALLQDRLVAWVVQRQSLRMVVTKVGKRSVEDLIERAEDSLAFDGDLGTLRQLLTNLHSLLMRPLLGYLTPGQTIVLVPDGALSAVPFAALHDGITQRFLIQDFGVDLAPSATLYLQAEERNRQLADSGPRNVLAVGDPDFDPELFPGLSRLPGAMAEVSQVASLYPDAKLLLGAAATKERLLALAGGYSVVHIAAHAQTPEATPLASTLALAGSAARGASGSLYAHELLGLRFSRTRLVVLSACSSAGSGRGNISGFVRPLLAVGVPSVVATLWRIDDQEAAVLMRSLHEFYRQVGDGPRALRAAQLRMLGERGDAMRRIAIWAAFQPYGAASGPGTGS